MDPSEAPTGPSAPRLQPSATPRRIGSVRIDEVLGSGGMGTVWRGFDEKLGRAVAVKAVRGESSDHTRARDRFRREAHLLSQINHPGICHVYDLIESDGTDYLVLELVEGRTLRAALSAGLARGEALRIAREVAEALAAAHEHQIVHRDLKPENVMLDARGRVKVLDFGIARLAGQPDSPTGETPPEEGPQSSQITRQGGLLGTPGYMSPEQAAERPLTPASDCFALGLLLQELLTARPAYPRLPLADLHQRLLAGATDPPEGLSAGATQLLRALLSLVPEGRPTATEAARRITDLLNAPTRRRARTRAALVATTLIAMAGISAWQWRQLRATAGQAPVRVLVLPFEATQGDETLGRGLSNEVVGRLRHLRSLRVLTAGAPGMPPPPGSALALGRQLSADVVVSGRAERAGNALQALLIEAAAHRVRDGREVWRGRYERAPARLASVEGQMAHDVAVALRVPIPPELASSFGTVPTSNVEAYQAYLRARGSPFILNHSPERYEIPIRLLDRAAALDPEFVQAHVELTNLHSAAYLQGIDRSERRAALARSHAARAAELAPSAPEVAMARGLVAYRLDHDLEGALAIFRSVAERVPSSGDARQAAAFVERRLGHLAEALVALQDAQSLSPQDPALALEVAHTLFLLRRHEEAQVQYERSTSLAPDQTSSYLFAAWNHWARGRRDDARDVLNRIPDMDQPFGLYFRYQQSLFDGRWDEALATIDRVREASVDWQLWAYPVALLRGFALEAAGRTTEARGEYLRAGTLSERRTREQPTDPRHQAALSLALASLGDGARAEAAARRAVSLYPPTQDQLFAPFFRKELAWALARAGRQADAERELTAVLAQPGWITRESIALDPRWRPTRLGAPR